MKDFDLGTLGEIRELRPQSSDAVVLKPDTRVLCIHRGREPYRDMYDSSHFVIDPGYFTAEYGAALHFKRRAVVPGSRNVETGYQASFIAILGVPRSDGRGLVKEIDDRADWDPFTDDECREYGHAVEAIDRASLVDPIDAAIDVVPVAGNRGAGGSAATSRIKGGGGTAGRNTRRNEISGPGAEALKTRNAPGENETTREIAAATAAAGAPE